MTLTRRIALRIANFVARYASPGWKEWAGGMAREAAYIESDSAALRWALGSTRVLFDWRGAPIRSFAQVAPLAMKLVRNARYGTATIGAAAMLPMSLIGLRGAAPWLAHLSGGISILWMAICFALWRMDRLRLEDPEDDKMYDREIECAVFYRSELQRHRFTMWVPFCAWYSVVVSFVAGNWSWMHPHPWVIAPFAVFGVVAVWGSWHAWHRNQRCIEEMGILLAEKA
jgi:hypothetical protein